MIRIFAYVVCLAGFVWIGLGNLNFRKAIRTEVREAHARMEHNFPGSAGGEGKILNSYYEAVYNNLPSTLLPASMLMVGATLLFLAGRRKNASPQVR